MSPGRTDSSQLYSELSSAGTDILWGQELCLAHTGFNISFLLYRKLHWSPTLWLLDLPACLTFFPRLFQQCTQTQAVHERLLMYSACYVDNCMSAHVFNWITVELILLNQAIYKMTTHDVACINSLSRPADKSIIQLAVCMLRLHARYSSHTLRARRIYQLVQSLLFFYATTSEKIMQSSRAIEQSLIFLSCVCYKDSLSLSIDRTCIIRCPLKTISVCGLVQDNKCWLTLFSRKILRWFWLSYPIFKS